MQRAFEKFTRSHVKDGKLDPLASSEYEPCLRLILTLSGWVCGEIGFLTRKGSPFRIPQPDEGCGLRESQGGEGRIRAGRFPSTRALTAHPARSAPSTDPSQQLLSTVSLSTRAVSEATAVRRLADF